MLRRRNSTDSPRRNGNTSTARRATDPPCPLGRCPRRRGHRRDGVHRRLPCSAAGGRVRAEHGAIPEREVDRAACPHDRHSPRPARTGTGRAHVRSAVPRRPIGARPRPGAARLAHLAAPGRRSAGVGVNVVYHEFAHKLDQLDGAADGMPPLPDRAARRAWRQTLGTNYRRLRRRGSDGLVRGYGATNPAEYFAVTSELFFTRPTDPPRSPPTCTNDLPSSTSRTLHAAADGASDRLVYPEPG